MYSKSFCFLLLKLEIAFACTTSVHIICAQFGRGALTHCTMVLMVKLAVPAWSLTKQEGLKGGGWLGRWFLGGAEVWTRFPWLRGLEMSLICKKSHEKLRSTQAVRYLHA
jgi:hypothetical protein